MNKNSLLKTLLVVAMFAPMAISAQSDTTRIQCSGITKKNIQCKNIAIIGRNLCWQHDSTYVKPVKVKSVQCSGITNDNTKCKNKTKHLSGKCHHHRD